MENQLQRDIYTVTTEIRTIKAQVTRQLLDGAIELGRRLCEAKTMLAHGEWGPWLRDEAGFSASSANNLMRVYEEYGDEQGSLFGATAKSQTLGDLTFSKAVALLAIPAEEREEFAAEVGADELSTRQLADAIRERNKAAERAEEAESDAEQARKTAEDAKEAMHDAVAAAHDAQREVDRLTEVVQNLDKALVEAKESAVQAAQPDKAALDAARDEGRATERSAARRAAKDEFGKKIDAATADKEKAEKQLAEAQKQLAEAQKQLADASALADKRVAAVEKKLAVASSESATTFKAHFESVQGPLNAMLECLHKLAKENPEVCRKLSAALRALCEKTVQGMPEMAEG
jgi:DNA repair exonuclease SbcCD ATPase subunit